MEAVVSATIYCLRDPRDRSVRYIGVTTQSMRTRLRQHINDKQANYRTNWIKSLKKHNLLPTIHEVAKVPRESIDHWERFWIQYFRSAGAKLTNLTNGGKAPLLGRSLTEEHRKKIGEANRGKKR